MARYVDIECDAVTEVLPRRAFKTRQDIQDFLDNIPTVDVVPIVYGKWGAGRFNLETGNYEEQCTHCRNFSQEYDKPYCPNCGAKMSGGKKDG